MVKGITNSMSPNPHIPSRIRTLSAILLTLLIAIPSPSFAQNQSVLAESIQSLTRNSRAREGTHTRLKFNTHHTQGMTRVGGRWFMTAVEVIDRANGVGKGHLFEFNDHGNLLRTLELSDGAMYHPGGIDFDGKHIWVCVAEYRPDSNSVVYRVDPNTLESTEVFRFTDHLGGIISIPKRNELIAVSWGSRRIYKWKTDNGNVLTPASPEIKSNASHFIDYQDGQWLRGTDLILMGGLASYKLDPKRGGSAAVGGIALLDTNTLLPVFELPIPLYSEKGRVMNQNPFYIAQGERNIEIGFVPDDNESTLYRYTFPVRNR